MTKSEELQFVHDFCFKSMHITLMDLMVPFVDVERRFHAAWGTGIEPTDIERLKQCKDLYATWERITDDVRMIQSAGWKCVPAD